MPKYIANVDTLIAHENRIVRAGQEFETEFPNGPDGKPMRIFGNLSLVEEKAGRRKSAAADDGSKGGEE